MSQAIVDKLSEMLMHAGLDALVCVSPENVTYAAGFVIPSHTLMRWRHAAVVITADGRESIVCVDMEETTVRANRPDIDVRIWSEFDGNPMTTLAELLTDLGLDQASIGVELSYLSADAHAQLAAQLPRAKLLPADALLVAAHTIKTDDELALLTRLSRISDQAIGAALGAVRAGDSEMDIAAALTRSVYEQGADSFKLMIVATGERSELPNVGPTNRVLIPGDICRVEIFSVIDGYQAGVCRTAIVGESPPEAMRIYRNLVECKHLIHEAIRPGVAANEIYRIYRDKFDELKLPPISFVGHSIGVNLHEAPYLGPYDEQILEAGMVLGTEPLVYRSGLGFGMQIKDMVAVSDSGCQLLSDVVDTDVPYLIEA